MHLTLCLLLVLWISETDAVRGEQPQTSPAPSVSPPIAIPLARVQLEAQDAGTVLSGIDEKVSRDYSATEAASSNLLKLSAEIESRVTEDTKILAANPSLDLLFRLAQTWQEYGRHLSAPADELTKRATALDDQIVRLNKLREIWQATLRSASEPEAPPLVLQRVQKVVDSIREERQRVEAARDQVITMLSRISADQAEIRTTLSSIRESQNHTLRNVSRRDSLPIWSLRADLGKEWSQRSKQSFDAELGASEAFSRRLPSTFLVHGFLVVLLAAAIRWMGHKVRHAADSDPDLSRATPILSLPISAALTLSVLGLPSIYPQAPRMIQASMGALMLIPILLILRKLLERDLLPILVALVATYFVGQLRLLAAGLPQVARLIFLVQLAGVTLFIVWLIRNPLRRPITGNSTKTLRIIAKLGLVVLPLAFVADICGYSRLGNLLGSIYFRGVFLAAVLYAAIRIIEGLLVVVLHLGPVAKLRSVRLHRTMLQRRTFRSLNLLAVFFWLSMVLNFFGLRTPLIEEIASVLTAKLTIGSLSISLSSILAFVAAIWASFLVSSFLRFLLEEDVYNHFKLSRGISYAISTMLHYVLLLLGFFAALSALGIDLTKITILAGAFSVGVGFGLQNIINNFVSGLILLFERPIKIGDVIEVGGQVGEVRRIGIRASVIGTADGSEVIVPNGSFISGQVTNWTFSDRRRAVEIPFNVANVGDPDRIVALLKMTAAHHPGVSQEPSPEAFIQSLTAGSIAVQLRVWTESYQDWARLRSELLVEVNEALAREKITLT